MQRPRLVIAPGKEKAIARRHPWIFSGALLRIEGTPAEGDLVDVVDSRGRWLATGHYQDETIVCKVLSFDTPDVGLPLLRQRLLSAIGYRRALGFFDNPDTNVFRLLHAEGDQLPGLVADFYNGVVVLQAHSLGMHRLLPHLVDILRECLADRLVAVFDKSSATCPGAPPDGFLWGSVPDHWTVLENGIHIDVNFFEGQKTGFFIDQRDNRRLVASLAPGRRVLNCFGYTGGFSLAALRGGAAFVQTVDISRKAIDLCNRNIAANFGPDAPHTGTVADVLDLLNAPAAPAQPPFDLIILDPPAFAKSHRHLQHGLRAYRSINQQAMLRIAPGGFLMTFSCSQAVSVDDFRTMIFTAAALSGKHLRVVRQLPHAPDHPVSIFHPEGEYLKGLLLQVE